MRSCNASAPGATTPCIYIYGGATALSLNGFDVAMKGGGAGACVFFDTGGGGCVLDVGVRAHGTSPARAYKPTRAMLCLTISHLVKCCFFTAHIAY